MTDADVLAALNAILNRRFGLDLAPADGPRRLAEFGVDSMHVLDIMMDLETDLGVQLESLAFPANPSLQEIAASIAEGLTSPGRDA